MLTCIIRTWCHQTQSTSSFAFIRRMNLCFNSIQKHSSYKGIAHIVLLFVLNFSLCVLWQVALSAFDPDVSLEVLDHPILDLFYYTVKALTLPCPRYYSIYFIHGISILNKCTSIVQLTEILPSALVLFVLRKLPPKRVSAQYHPINQRNFMML